MQALLFALMFSAPECDVQALHDAAVPSVVQVEVGGVVGTAFAFGEHFVTGLHFPQRGGDLVLVVEGKRYPAEVIAIDEPANVAILRSPLKLPPLAPRTETVTPGLPVVALGRAREGTAVVDGRAIHVGSEIQVSANLGGLGAGGPVIDCAGLVVGLATGKTTPHGSSIVTPVAKLGELMARPPDPDALSSRWYGTASILVALASDSEFDFGTGLRFRIGAGVGGFWLWFESSYFLTRDASVLPDGTVVRTRNERDFGFGLGYRFRLSEGLVPITLTLGAGANLVLTTDTTVSLEVAGETLETFQREDEGGDFVTGGVLRFGLGELELGYELGWRFGTEELRHVFTVGLTW